MESGVLAFFVASSDPILHSLVQAPLQAFCYRRSQPFFVLPPAAPVRKPRKKAAAARAVDPDAIIDIGDNATRHIAAVAARAAAESAAAADPLPTPGDATNAAALPTPGDATTNAAALPAPGDATTSAAADTTPVMDPALVIHDSVNHSIPVPIPAAARIPRHSEREECQPASLTMDQLEVWSQRMLRDFNSRMEQQLQAQRSLHAQETAQLRAQIAAQQSGPRIEPRFLSISPDVKAKIRAGRYVDYAALWSMHDDKSEPMGHVVIQGNEERLMRLSTSKKSLPDFKAWLQVHVAVTNVLVDRTQAPSSVAAMLHHLVVVAQYNSRFEWEGVSKFDQAKRKLVEEQEGNYQALTWINFNDEQHLSLRSSAPKAKSSPSTASNAATRKRPRPQITASGQAPICMQHLNGRCTFGQSCTYRHVRVIDEANKEAQRAKPYQLPPPIVDTTAVVCEDPYDDPNAVFRWPTGTALRSLREEIFEVRPWLIAEAWSDALQRYPNRALAEKFVAAITNGANIGYSGPRNCNYEWDSPTEKGSHPARFLATLRKEQLRGHFLGPFRRNQIPFQYFIACPVYAVPKNDKYDRLIHDLTVKDSPHAVNFHIDKTRFEIKLPRLADICSAILEVKATAPNAFLWADDVQEAFHHVKLDVASRPWFTFKIGERYYVRTTISFGSRSSPGLWQEVTDMFLWVLHNTFPNTFGYLHCYVDDFLGIGSSLEHECRNQIRFHRIAKTLGIRLDPAKRCLPSQRIRTLGYDIDTVSMTVSTPDDKLSKAKARIRECIEKPRISRKDLERIHGTLAYLSQTMPAGRTFLFRVRRALSSPNNVSFRIPAGVREDLETWLRFLDKWNGSFPIQRESNIDATDIGLFTDASDWGLGIINLQENDFHYRAWNPDERDFHIGVREMIASKSALCRWGHLWSGKTIVMHTDNRSNVEAMAARRSRTDPKLATLLREMFFIELQHRCRIILRHLPGKQNVLADMLSRNRIKEFEREFQRISVYGHSPTSDAVNTQIKSE